MGVIQDFLGFDPTPGFSLGIDKSLSNAVNPPKSVRQPTSTMQKVQKSAPAPASSGVYYGGSGGSGTAKAASRNNYITTQGGYKEGARTQLRDVGNTYRDKTNSFIDEITQGQDAINRGLAQNQLNLRRTMANIVRTIQQGIRSGGVSIGGMGGSLDSSAGDALARAYAKVGNQQSGEARGQASTQEEDLQRQQGQLTTKRNQGSSSLDTFRDTETNRVRSDFGNKLALLKAQANGEGVGDAVDNSLVDQVLGEAISNLAAIDADRNNRLSGVREWNPDEVMKEAIRLDDLGQAADTFSVTDPTVSAGQSGGAQLGDLPIYMRTKKDAVTA